MTTVGGFELVVSLPVVPPSVSTSSSCTILMTCCAGAEALRDVGADARSLMRAMNCLTTRDVDVGLEQREADLARDLVDVGLA